ncbi:MAG: hypothetical protein V4772_23605 [Pseudomonadota bacterium]
MLQTYQAELNGSQLIWIDQPPVPLTRRRVVVVVEDVTSPSADAASAVTADRVRAFANARGCMGRAGRDEILAGLAALREDWVRDPLGGERL